ncbi:TPA: AAA family ATPase [Clostridioides difficile]|nr:AAA family ATPase [Clostridioides difficile]HBF4487343.1 AAA family ATPase [Clostridioides difficile]HBF4534042.1 AAA family ATPase [Clostridioides difficile]HBF4844434.1 AAA family ATPase [Clostridioides difficile]HBF5071042.1 AAA family ATPase [Clostridioides difficile]
MQFSHSRIGVFKSCPYKYKLQYIDKVKTILNADSNNALILGTSLHTGIEKDIDAAVKEYYFSYPSITDLHINEVMKLDYLIPKVKEILPKGFNEVQITTSDFIGFIDLLAPHVYMTDTNLNTNETTIYYEDEERVFDIYDFKYSNNIDRYLESEQLHLYKYFYEKQHTNHEIKDLYYVFVPKIQIRQKKTENLHQFRKRLLNELDKSEIKIVKVEYDPNKVINFLVDIKRCLENKEFEKNQNKLCNWCDYQEYCEKGIDYMLLPNSERRSVEGINKKTLWIYGAPFSGKTTLANDFEKPLMLNTDGNIKFVDAPYISIKDIVTVEGRMTKRQLAWDVFKEAIRELEKKENDFETIIVDLLEDTYEACRLYMYDKMGITHESDDSFRAWDKVRTEFLSTIKRLMNLDYKNIILISHEDTSKDITKKGGDKITAIKPNLQEKAANKIAGMVDIVARVVADGDVRTLSFKTNEVIFGGGRLKVKSNEIPLDYNELMKVYDDISIEKKDVKESSKTKKSNAEEDVEMIPIVEETSEKTEKEQTDEEVIEQEEAIKPVKKTRKKRS